MKPILRAFHRHSAYASMTLATLLALFEYAVPGSVLPYVPLFPAVILGILLLVTMPAEEKKSLTGTLFAGLVSLLIVSWLVLNLGGNGKGELILLLAAAALVAAALIGAIKKQNT
jgi:hypothetical protein